MVIVLQALQQFGLYRSKMSQTAERLFMGADGRSFGAKSYKLAFNFGVHYAV
jgi:hypothetical protein